MLYEALPHHVVQTDGAGANANETPPQMGKHSSNNWRLKSIQTNPVYNASHGRSYAGIVKNFCMPVYLELQK